MNLLSIFLNTCMFWVAGYTGFNKLDLYFIVIAAFLGMLAWMAVRLDVCMSYHQEHGVLAFIFRLIPTQIFTYSIISGIIYGIAYGIALIIE